MTMYYETKDCINLSNSPELKVQTLFHDLNYCNVTGKELSETLDSKLSDLKEKKSKRVAIIDYTSATTKEIRKSVASCFTYEVEVVECLVKLNPFFIFFRPKEVLIKSKSFSLTINFCLDHSDIE